MFIGYLRKEVATALEPVRDVLTETEETVEEPTGASQESVDRAVSGISRASGTVAADTAIPETTGQPVGAANPRENGPGGPDRLDHLIQSLADLPREYTVTMATTESVEASEPGLVLNMSHRDGYPFATVLPDVTEGGAVLYRAYVTESLEAELQPLVDGDIPTTFGDALDRTVDHLRRSGPPV